MRSLLVWSLCATVCHCLPGFVDQTHRKAAGLPDELVKLEFDSIEATERAKRALEERGDDIWQSRKTRLLVRSRTRVEQLVLTNLTSSLALALPVNDNDDGRASTRASEEALKNVDTSRLSDPIHSTYHPLDSVNAILRLLANDFDGMAHLVELGKSSEQRPINALKITGRKNHPNKKEFLIVAGQHSREWISTSTVLYVAHQILLQAASGDPLLDYFTFTFVPVTNPDGYVYTFTTDRLWRKNRQRVSDDCFGIDLNRNWGHKWQGGTRPNPCSDAYPGPSAFAAPELVALKSYIENESNNVLAFLDLHSFGQMLMFPYSYSCDETSKDEENHFEAVVGAAKALRAVHGKTFEVGSVCSVSLTSPGESIDWTYTEGQVKWSFTAELRDAGIFGFLLPPSQIRPSGEEMYAAIMSLSAFIVEREK